MNLIKFLKIIRFHKVGSTGNVMSNILAQEYSYECLNENDTENEILQLLVSDEITVLLDAGALMIRYSNKEVAQKWLELNKNNNNIEAAVFFEENDLVVIQKISNKIQSFETSIYLHNLSKCLIYLDDIHTRGTDIKIPTNTTAGVTLGNGLTKDRLFQACMRMRMLGDGHHVKFYASNEVNSQIEKKVVNKIHSHHVLEWAIDNSIKQIKNDLFFWAHQGLSFYLRKASYDNFIHLKHDLESYFNTCKEKSSNSLSHLYGQNRLELFIVEIIQNSSNKLKRSFESINTNSEDYISVFEGIINKLKEHIPNLRKFDQLLNEEMELEIEKEIEQEIEIERPNEAKPYKQILDRDVEQFVKKSVFNKKSASFIPFMQSLKSSTIYEYLEENAWSNKIYATKCFAQTVETKDFDDYFLRIPRWIATNRTCVNEEDEIYLIMSSFEADSLFFSLQDTNKISFLMMMPRNKQDQRFISYPSISIPPQISQQILIFCGSFYFKDKADEEIFLAFAGYLPSPRKKELQIKFEEKLITPNGYVPYDKRSQVYLVGDNKCEFINDPSNFIKKLIEIRNYNLVPDSSHYLAIFLNGKRSFE